MTAPRVDFVDEQDLGEPTSWTPVDLRDVLDGRYAPPRPTVGQRADGQGLLYPGRTHSLAGESEAGKSWVAQLIITTELAAGNAAVFIDFEDDEGAVIDRLRFLGASTAALSDRFAYLRPEEPIWAPGASGDLQQVIADLAPTLVVLDGVTEALTVHGLNGNDNKDLAEFGRKVVRPIAQSGPATFTLDHVVKDRENRGRYALGGVHKLNGLTGAGLILECVDRFGVGLVGRSRLLVAKDRPGQLRRHALPIGGAYLLGDFVLDGSGLNPEPATLREPAEPGPFRPTVVMRKVSDALAGAAEPLSGQGIQDRVGGKAPVVRQATAILVDEGYVSVAPGPRGAKLHTLVKAFDEATP